MSDNNEKLDERAGAAEPSSPSAEEAAQAARAADDAAAREDFQLPKVDFATFVLSLASSALVQLGEVPNPESGNNEQNLPVAKHTIDILAMLHEKTGPCLTPEESRLMEGVLYELRMKYVIKAG